MNGFSRFTKRGVATRFVFYFNCNEKFIDINLLLLLNLHLLCLSLRLLPLLGHHGNIFNVFQPNE